MSEDRVIWKKPLIAVIVVALCTVGLGIIVYVGLARDRLAPTPTPPPPSQVSPTAPMDVTPTAVPAEVVLGVVREYSPGALIIVLTPLEGTIEQVIVTEGVRVSRADGSPATPADITAGVTIRAEGALDSLKRLVASAIAITATEPPTPTTTAMPDSTPVPSPTTSVPTPDTPVGSWRGEYYDNPNLSGTPALVRQEETIDFAWQGDAPTDALSADNFSVRWRGRWTFEEGGYRFYAYADDGVRVWVDGVIVVDRWRNQTAEIAYGDIYMEPGEHEVQVEYFEGIDQALVRAWWDYRGRFPDWEGAYYNNPDLVGEPVLVRNDVDVNFDWGSGAPATGMPTDNFGVRWTQTLVLEAGAYRFNARVDDGLRLWVDGVLIIDEWHPGGHDTYAGHILLDNGPHDVRVEYLELGGNALVRVWWDRTDSFSHWKGEYFANRDLSGRTAFVRDDPDVDFDWGEGSPGSGLPVDGFSARWTRERSFEAGRYEFWALADDGVRVMVGGEVVIDAWHDYRPDTYQATVNLTGGKYPIVVEYYENGGAAHVQIGWRPAATATPTATPEPATPTATAQPPTSTPTAQPPTATHTPPPPTATHTPEAPTATPEQPTATLTPEPTAAEPEEAPTATTEPVVIDQQ